MIKRVLLMATLLSANVMAQQNTDISETDFSSGAANDRLATLGRQAAASGKQLVVTAPQHWHSKIAASIRSGGKVDLVLKDGFYETVLVRVEDKKIEEVPKPEVKPVVAPAPVRQVPVQAAPVAPVQAPAPAPAPEVKAAAPVAAPVVAEPAAEEVEPEALPEVVESAPAAAIDPAAFVGAEPGDVDPVRGTMEKQYNEGRRISERLPVKDLRNGDVIYVRNTAAVVVRREGARMLRFWLEGEINLTQTGISAEGSNKYRILKPSMR